MYKLHCVRHNRWILKIQESSQYLQTLALDFRVSVLDELEYNQIEIIIDVWVWVQLNSDEFREKLQILLTFLARDTSLVLIRGSDMVLASLSATDRPLIMTKGVDSFETSLMTSSIIVCR